MRRFPHKFSWRSLAKTGAGDAVVALRYRDGKLDGGGGGGVELKQ
jgi:hypothetical protein